MPAERFSFRILRALRAPADDLLFAFMSPAVARIVRIPRMLLKGLVRLYQYAISPYMPSSCRYTPSCSQYAAEAFEKYGALKGSALVAGRLLRCAPWGRGGYDPPRWRGEKDAAERP